MNHRFSELTARLSLTLLAEARARPGLSPEDAARMERAFLELPRPPGATLVLIEAPAGARAIDATLLRGAKEPKEERKPEVAAEGIRALHAAHRPGRRFVGDAAAQAGGGVPAGAGGEGAGARAGACGRGEGAQDLDDRGGAAAVGEGGGAGVERRWVARGVKTFASRGAPPPSQRPIKSSRPQRFGAGGAFGVSWPAGSWAMASRAPSPRAGRCSSQGRWCATRPRLQLQV